MPADAPTELRIRGHHLLCMLGFRGLGYSPQFVANMRAVVESYGVQPPPTVEVLAGVDCICRACPHMRQGACARADGSEQRVRARDMAVLRRLGLEAGQRVPASEVRRRIAAGVDVPALGALCADCNWFDYGYCAEGLAELRREAAAGSVDP